ncbi:class I SAM-dependent methyltransferase [Candidatus Daviesbacteria bacterium]|nr:class I SAM-dependent methyltransferase [Candidatus Daviesbacteria bacterium]
MPVHSVEKYLQDEKIARDDLGTYIGNLLVRQRLVNEAVLEFAQPILPAKSLVIDACAGPEGSWLAAARRGYQWVGNDISVKFAHTLRRTGANVVMSDFPNAPFKDEIADAVFFIFALNNICNPKEAFDEAARITKPGGVIVGAEPGLSTWVTKILFHSVLSPSSKRIPFSQEIEKQFADKPYSEMDYTDLLAEKTLGLTTADLATIAQTAASSETKIHRAHYRFHETILKIYFAQVLAKSQNAGFKLEKAGILAIAQSLTEWEVSAPIELTRNQWLDQFMQVRVWKRGQNSPVDQLPPSMDRAARRIIVPILCMKKS